MYVKLVVNVCVYVVDVKTASCNRSVTGTSTMMELYQLAHLLTLAHHMVAHEHNYTSTLIKNVNR